MRKLLDYLPPILHGVREFRALNDAEQVALDRIWSAVWQTLDDHFIPTATDYGLRQWETMLRITPKATATLDERRFTVLSMLAEQTPFTERSLARSLASLCGEGEYSLELDHGAYAIHVDVGLAAKSKYDDVVRLLARVVPANLTVTVRQKYNQHQTFTPYTHRALTAFTHDTLRNEVLNNG